MQILPYITVAIFVAGLLYRLGRWASARIVHNIVLTPAPPTVGGAALNYAGETLLFKSLFKGDKPLWAGAWIMHVALLAIIGGHVLGFAFLGEQFQYIGTTPELSVYLSDLLGTTMGIIIWFALIYLLYRRLAVTEVKLVSNTADYLMLILIITIVTLGNIMRLFPDFSTDYQVAQTFFIQFGTFQAIDYSNFNFVFVLHLLTVQLLLIVFPFSKLLHSIGMFAHRWILDRPYVEPAPGMPGAKATVSSGTTSQVSAGETTAGGV